MGTRKHSESHELTPHLQPRRGYSTLIDRAAIAERADAVEKGLNGGGCGMITCGLSFDPAGFVPRVGVGRWETRVEKTASTSAHRANRSSRGRGGSSRMIDLCNSRTGIPARNGRSSKDPATMRRSNDCGIAPEATPVRSKANAESSLFRQNRELPARSW
jgi:hypothetical protein